MIKSDYYRHEEFINPDDHFKGFWGRIAIIVVALVVELYLFVKVGMLIANGEEAMLMIMMIMIVVLPMPLVWFFFDSMAIFRTSFRIMGKVLITQTTISTIIGGNIVRQLQWKDVEIIEKSREHGEIVITCITNKMNDKFVICSDKRANYIQLPARPSIVEAIRKFSRQDVTIKDPSVNRFASYH